MDDLSPILASLQSQQDLTREQMRSAIVWLLSGNADPGQMQAFLILLAEKGETVEELTGAAQALRATMFRIEARRQPVVDTCGTGGDGSKTFNISTAAALALASCGVAVAKHGNRKITSSTGSADVLAELGINLEAPPQVAQACLDSLGICFCFAPYFHPAMKNVGEVRRAIASPTIFNRLGPLANPASANCQVLGVGAADLQIPMAQTLQQLGTQRSLIVRGEDGVDELSLSGPTRVIEVTKNTLVEHCWSPADFGLKVAPRDQLFADDPSSSAQCIRDVFAGKPGACRDVVIMNAAAGLWLTAASRDLRECAQQVASAIDDGKALELISQLGALTHSNSSG